MAFILMSVNNNVFRKTINTKLFKNLEDSNKYIVSF